jgi:hypothetical protein
MKQINEQREEDSKEKHRTKENINLSDGVRVKRIDRFAKDDPSFVTTKYLRLGPIRPACNGSNIWE